MDDLQWLREVDSLIWTVAWRATTFLALGLAASFALRRRPARAHQALLLAMIGAVAAPALTEAGRRLGLGLWGEDSKAPVVAASVAADSASVRPEVGPVPSPAAMPETPHATSTPPPSPIGGDAAFDVPNQQSRPVPWRTMLLATWGAASASLLIRLVASFVAGRRLVRRAEAVTDGVIDDGLAAAARGLGLHVTPGIARSTEVRCPVIWCWGSRPLLLMPSTIANEATEQVAVFRHELAHWRRRDHLSTLVAELLVVLLPWHPLAWAARARLGSFAELACDDWVLAGGTPAADYAAALLSLLPQPYSPALAAASGRSGLRHRIVRILSDHLPIPTAGPRWTAAACLAMLLAASLAAMAQARPAPATLEEPPKVAEPPKADASLKTVRGKVLDPDGKPLAGVTVLWNGWPDSKLSPVAIPKGGDLVGQPWCRTIDRAETNGDGTFTLRGQYPDGEYVKFKGVHLVVRHPGTGMLSVHLTPKEEAEGVTLKLPREQVVRGRLLTPSGSPAAGVLVVLQGFSIKNERNEWEGDGVELLRRDEGLPDYWPRAVSTDAEGRFVMEGVPIGMYVWLGFWHPDFAVDDVTVNTIPERPLFPEMKEAGIKPVEPTFERVLEPARPVEGRVVDRVTGAPLADVNVEIVSMSAGEKHTRAQWFRIRSDANGYYRVSGHMRDTHYRFKAYPASASGYLTLREDRDLSKTKDRSLKVDLALDKGRVVTGRVVDRDGKSPVSGAAVAYQSEANNPNYKYQYELGNPVVTDADGRFQVVALLGKGFLAVEAPSDQYVRMTRRAGASHSAEVYPHGVFDVDLSGDGDISPVEIEVRKGQTLEARVLDPDGRPVDSFSAMCKGLNAPLITGGERGLLFSDGLFRIPGAVPEKTYRVYFIAPARRLAAIADLKLDVSGRQSEVRLQPSATIKGKVEGHLPESRLSLQMFHSPAARELTQEELRHRAMWQDYGSILTPRDWGSYTNTLKPDGTFSIECVIPGSGYRIVGGLDTRWEVGAFAWDLKPGEVRDVGTLTLKKRRKEERHD